MHPGFLSWKSVAVKVGGTMILAATSDAVVGAAATILVGFFAAMSAILVAWIQSRTNKDRDKAIEQVVEVTKKLSELEHQRAEELALELARREREEAAEHGETP